MSDPRPWLHVPVEVHVREFDCRLLTACCAIERGFGVVIGKKNPLVALLPILPPGIILDRSLSTFREPEFRHYREVGHRLVVSDEEGFAFYRMPDIAFQQRISEATLSLADRFFAFGREQVDVIGNQYPGLRDRLSATGTYRTDLMRKEFHGLHATTVADIHQRYGKYILWPSNFSSHLSIAGDREWVIDQFKSQGGIKTPEQEAYMNRAIDLDEKAFDAFVAALPRIAGEFPDHTVVVRPHPGEDPDFWRSFSCPAENVKVVLEGNVAPWLLGAECVFHHGCTTGLEAFIMGTQSVAFHPFYDPSVHEELPTRLGPIVENVDDLVSMIRIAVSGNEIPRDDPSWLNGYYMFDGDGLAAERIADELVELVPSRSRFWSAFRWLGYLRTRLRRRLAVLQRRTVSKMRGEEVRPMGGTLRWVYMEPPDVLARIEEFRAVSGMFQDLEFSCEQLMGQTFLLTGCRRS